MDSLPYLTFNCDIVPSSFVISVIYSKYLLMCSDEFEFLHNVFTPLLYNIIGNVITWHNLLILVIINLIYELDMTWVVCHCFPWFSTIVTIRTQNFWPSYWGIRRNVWPSISCSINNAILVELGYLCLLGSIFLHFSQGFYHEAYFHHLL